MDEKNMGELFTCRKGFLGAAGLILLISFSSLRANADEKKTEPGNRVVEESGTQSAGKKDSSSFATKAARTLLAPHQASFFGHQHTIDVFPIAYLSLRTGLNLGFRSYIQAAGRDPYLYRLTFQVLASLKGEHKHKVIFEYPYIAGSRFGIRVRAQWERDLEARYFGIGNNSVNAEELTRAGRDGFVHEDFYFYNLKRPWVTVHGTYQVVPKVLIWFGFGIQQVDPQLKHGAATSFLAQERPFGFMGGTGRWLSFRLSWDTRTDPVFPTGGFLSELTFEPNFGSVKEQIVDAGETATRSGNVEFLRYTFSDAHFLPLRSGRLIFANRVAFEAIAGEAPYYAFGEIAGERRTRVLGGSQSLRGFQSRRFQDKIKLFTLSEIRYRYRTFDLAGQSFELIFMAFFDTGRVWHQWSEIAFKNFHRTFGAGIWINWNDALIARLEIGRSPEDIIPFLRLGTAF